LSIIVRKVADARPHFVFGNRFAHLCMVEVTVLVKDQILNAASTVYAHPKMWCPNVQQ
jgi:hypothetical protein